MQECKRCKATGLPNQMIGFEKVGEDPNTGKIIWKLIDENGGEHTHKHIQDLPIDRPPSATLFKRRRVVDIVAITDVTEAKKLLASGWEYKTSYPATIANIPHYVLVKRE
jgi:hypothetical protein